jgi:uncharacterized protein (DUF58 family)
VARSTRRGLSALPDHDSHSGIGITRLRPTWRGAGVMSVALALVAFEVTTGDSALLLLVVVVALPLLVAPVLVLGRAHRALGAEIHLMVTPPLVPVGARSDLLVQLTNAGDAVLPPSSLDRPSDQWRTLVSSGPTGASPSLPRVTWAPDLGRLIGWDRVGLGESASCLVPLPTQRRGVFTTGSLRWWVHDPFALFGLAVATARPATLVVHPPVVLGTTPPSVRPGSSASTQFGDGSPGAHGDDPGGEWSGLRPYEPGDRLHLLSWQAEARSGVLLVHDFRPDSEDVVTIVFDDRAGVHRRDAFEKALATVYGLASAVEGGATDYDLSTLSGRRVRGATTPDGLAELLTFLAETQPTRSSQLGGPPGSSSLPSGALVITTPTAAPSLPPSLDGASVVVVE